MWTTWRCGTTTELVKGSFLESRGTAKKYQEGGKRYTHAGAKVGVLTITVVFQCFMEADEEGFEVMGGQVPSSAKLSKSQ